VVVYRELGRRREEREHIAIVAGPLDKLSQAEPTLARVQSECWTGETLGSLKCDCREQLDRAVAAIEEEGHGVIVYLRQEGRGIGLGNKIRAYALQAEGADTVEANEQLGFKPDLRNYGIGAQILLDLGVRDMLLLTSSKTVLPGSAGYGLKIIGHSGYKLPDETEVSLEALMAKSAAEAEASRKQDPQLFREGRWTFERRYNSRSLIDGRYVSIVRSDYMDTHGAHPNSNVDTILWDAASRKRISIRPFFAETADNGPTMKAMLKAVIASLNIEKKKRDATETATAEWYKSLESKLLKIGAVTLAPSTETDKSSGLTFHFPPYAVGPYAEGEYVAFVPWETLKPYLTPEGTRIFGGARPKGDDDRTR